MTPTALDDETVPRTRRRTTMVAIVIAGAAMVTTCLVAVLGSVVVVNASALHRVAFGWPGPWLFQDQTGLDPAYPHRSTFLSPWENPSSIHIAALAVDILVVLVPLLLVWLALRRVGRDG